MGLRALFSPNGLNHFHIVFSDVLSRWIEGASIIDLSFIRLARAKNNTASLGHPSCKYSSSCHKLDPRTESRWTGPIWHIYSKTDISCGLQVRVFYLDMNIGISVIKTLSIIVSII